jgi:hypothetical protein
VLFHRGAGRRINVEKYVSAILFMEVIKTTRNQFGWPGNGEVSNLTSSNCIETHSVTKFMG